MTIYRPKAREMAGFNKNWWDTGNVVEAAEEKTVNLQEEIPEEEAAVEGEEVQHLNAEEEIGEEKEKAEEDTRMREDEESEEDSRRWIMAKRQEQERMVSSSVRVLRRPKAREMMGYAGFGEPVQNDEEDKSNEDDEEIVEEWREEEMLQ